MTQKERELLIFERGRAVGVKQMAKIAIDVYNELDRETGDDMKMWVFRVFHTSLGQAEDFLAEWGEE